MTISSLAVTGSQWPGNSPALPSPDQGLRSLASLQSASMASGGPERLEAPTDAAQEHVVSEEEVREAFHRMVGQTLFGQMLGAMRKTVGKPAYMHGGRAEEVFQAQLDQVLAEKLTEASSETLSQPMYELFQLPRL